SPGGGAREAIPPGTAQVWVDTSGGSCARRAVPTAWVDASACGSLPSAYRVARAGDTVNIVDGVYASQTLTGGTKAVRFQAAGPGRPRFGQIVSAASGITLRGVAIEGRDVDGNPHACPDPDNAVLYPCGARQTFENVIVDGLGARGADVHGIRGVGDHFVLRNSEIRNIVDNKGFEAGADDMVLDHNLWHGIVSTSEFTHNECAYVDGGNRQIWRRNRFVGCPTMAMYFTNWDGGSPYRQVLIENNMFGHTLDDEQAFHSGCGVVLGLGQNRQNTFIEWTVRYNTFESSVCSDGSPSGVDDRTGRWYGNVGTGWGCAPEFVYHHNVGTACGRQDLAVAAASNDRGRPNRVAWYVNAPGGNLHLRPGTRPIGRGDPTDYPRIDIDGQRRPQGRAPDAGADEAG
ncbi:MAG TPA: hypothetical protein VJ689_11605, partial [Gaiellaceae bacterium]|nr:hypothetical protein [Gaiellaceae bacterium]